MTKKLEDQSLEEEQRFQQKECQVEDSGTESDDETEEAEEAAEEGEDSEAGGDCNLDSGVSLNLRTSGHAPENRTRGLGDGVGRTRQLPSLDRRQLVETRNIEQVKSEQQEVTSGATGQHPGGHLELEFDNDQDQHSSEEELEDIIGTGAKKVYTDGCQIPIVGGAGSGVGLQGGSSGNSIKSEHQGLIQVGISTRQGQCGSTNPEKRKWSEVNRGSNDEEELQVGASAVFRAGSGSSGDEEVSGLMDGAGGGSYTPVQFCTSPPLDVYKPRKSQSPPPKLFHMSHMNGHSSGGSGSSGGPPRQNSLDVVRSSREGQRPSGAFRQARPRIIRPVCGPGLVEYSSLPASHLHRGDLGQSGGLILDTGPYNPESLPLEPSNGGVLDGDLGVSDEGGHRSPNKRHRSTPKPQNIQRPCLDFEKMQQIKTRVVTSWRQGTELSLFCW